MKHIFAVVAVVLMQVGTLTACGSSPAGHEDGSTPRAIVTTAQFQKSYSIISDMTGASKGYLPFEYKPDGCYARALYMAMSLADSEIPSTAVFAFQKTGGPALRLKDGVTTWWYHVAPMLKEGDKGEETIVDPAMGKGSHLALTSWLDEMQVTAADINLFRVHGSIYATDVTGDGASGNVRNDPLITEFSQLTPFKLNDIQSACNRMHEYLAEEPAAGRGMEARRTTLYAETGRFLKNLDAKSKLDKNLGEAAISCGGKKIDVASGSVVEEAPAPSGVETPTLAPTEAPLGE